MALETASYVANLVQTNPDGSDARSTADDHLRLIKAALKRTFPNLDAAVSLSAAQIAYLNDVSASVQAQLNALRDGSATVNIALTANSASFATLASHAASASFATLAATANSASYAALAGQAASASFAALARTANSASFATLCATANSASFATSAAHARSASFATTAATATNATDANSASSAATLTGIPPSSADTGSTVAVRNSSGDLFVRFVNSSATPSSSLSVGHIFCMTASDGYARPTTVARVGEYMEARNITGRSGTRKTLVNGSGPPSLAGSTNGDIWYYY